MDQRFLLGFEFIDRQHEELYRRMDKLLETCMTRACSVEAADMLAYLDEYVVTHFAAEEALQREGGYPGYEQHCLMHAAFIGNMGFVRHEIAAKGLTDSVIQHISQMLIEWFGRHVLEHDRTMSDYLRDSVQQRQ